MHLLVLNLPKPDCTQAIDKAVLMLINSNSATVLRALRQDRERQTSLRNLARRHLKKNQTQKRRTLLGVLGIAFVKIGPNQCFKEGREGQAVWRYCKVAQIPLWKTIEC
jgi:hypothetical protein